MKHLSDEELDQLLSDAGRADKRLRPISRDYQALQPRITRLLEEQRTLRDQAAEREHMAALEGEN
jgi:hypothetical protein